ncbi:MAG: hypothetical protein K2Y37_22985 [Pirellulales bacterium]|nr:hypothetical protein [Pirellulales bacterium]
MPELTPELRAAVDDVQGGPLFVEAEGSTYIVMSVDAYRSLAGVESDEDLADSVAHLQAAMEQVRRGDTQPLDTVLDEIAARHGLSR